MVFEIRARPGREGFVTTLAKIRIYGEDVPALLAKLKDAGYGAYPVTWREHRYGSVDQALAHTAMKWRIAYVDGLTNVDKALLTSCGAVRVRHAFSTTLRKSGGYRTERREEDIFVFPDAELGMLATAVAGGVALGDHRRARQALGMIEVNPAVSSAVAAFRSAPTSANRINLEVAVRLGKSEAA